MSLFTICWGCGNRSESSNQAQSTEFQRKDSDLNPTDEKIANTAVVTSPTPEELNSAQSLSEKNSLILSHLIQAKKI